MSLPRVRAQGSRVLDDVLGILFGTTISVLAVLYIVMPHVLLLVAWECTAVVYLVLALTLFRNRSIRKVPDSLSGLPRRVLEHLSWVFPIAASATGVAAAVTLLTRESGASSAGTGGWVVGVFGSIGVIVAWALLQTGFAEIYESRYARLPDVSVVSFPGNEHDPTLGEFLYLAFLVGTTASPDGAVIASREFRRLILIHSLTSFFYNAFLIAIAIQVIQGIIATG